ncbi:M67 family metallopeptidase [Sneathiella marina]|uniref:M67 family metallopeptidase n=1 Tax=Sneathiella marina TaxID=2950108 RepID=A0ABY4W9C6_9PROT|nr:M67 family metallopeptidase [Sneathiella marina]USG62723.1 M67 family metallopeptidase [Sneathiella marina]
MRVDISPSDLDCLTRHTEACWPDEACALIVGQYLQNQHWIVKRVEPAKNVAADKSRYFEIDPELRIKVEMNILLEDDEIIGVFHSHPEGKAFLSENDIKNIKEPNLFWLIASTSSGKLKEFRAFIAADDRNFDQLTLQTTSTAYGD